MSRTYGRGHRSEVRAQRANYVTRCGATHKVQFLTHEQALTRAGEILSAAPRSIQNRAGSFRAYRCKFCGLYHLTSILC